ncbi:alpha/beta hydrolase [Chitinophaga pendula]|uniref:alpha/beta fold hydrolase n=1 Tax=Chitinophaga TaxID=79328 RepID=UPI000BAF378D|nr:MULTISPECIES: alpha/beta hydrolase [Chitinophaga]ASZ12533.1 alpha/beta hydrolase [Chitinophaga sp. MD30]UCJ09863.1 alpha/beta hydrolase [Chitinophaga pendula]
MDIIQKNNIHIIGNPDATQTLVFGHGFGIDQRSFAQVTPAFENEYKIVLFDNVGGGAADINAYSPKRYESINGYVADVADILQQLNLQHVTFVGHSVSGMIGLLTAVQHTDSIEKLILLGSSPRYLNDPEKGYIGGFDQPTLDSLFETMEGNYHAWAAGFSVLAMRNDDRPELAAAFAASLQAIRPDIAIQVAKAIFYLDYRNELAKVTQPALIIQTTNDIAVPAIVSEYLEANIPGSKRVSVQTQGHFPQISAPEEVIEAIRSFL